MTSASRRENILDIAISCGGVTVSEVCDPLFESDHRTVVTRFTVSGGIAFPVALAHTAYTYKRTDFIGLCRALNLLSWDTLNDFDVDS